MDMEKQHPKCECGENFGLAVFGDQWWCPKCLRSRGNHVINAVCNTLSDVLKMPDSPDSRTAQAHLRILYHKVKSIGEGRFAR
ncbi:hypothetical protein LCGC14_0249820 [marine sediment metagenome]|uniref:Uncharacterized protein n=1 Tax=marine sediment metagenome TaxID=412755 RepID=A0A0F9U9W4_9ZZZZ